MTQVIYIISGGGYWGPERHNQKIQNWVNCGIIKPDIKLIFGLQVKWTLVFNSVNALK